MSISINSQSVVTTLFTAGALSLGTIALSQIKAISWLNTPMTPQGLAFCTGINVLALATSTLVGKAEDEYTSHAYRLGVSIAALIGSAALLTLCTKPISQKLGVALNTYAIAQLAAFHAAIKTLVYTAYHIFYNKRNFLLLSIEEMKKLTPTEVGQYKAHFEKQTSAWEKLGLKNQAAFNVLLKKNQQPIIPFTTDITAVELTKEEVEVFQEFAFVQPTFAQAKVLFDHHVAVPTQTDVLPGPAVDRVDVSKLSYQQLTWYHKHFKKHAEELSFKQRVAFADAFFTHNLEQPHETFIFEPVLSTITKELSKKQAQYCAGYYTQYPEAFLELRPAEQSTLNDIFSQVGLKQAVRPLTEPIGKHLEELSKANVQVLDTYYSTYPELWSVKPSSYQNTFNQTLTQHNLPTRELTQKPWSTVKKVAVIASIIILLVGSLYREYGAPSCCKCY